MCCNKPTLQTLNLLHMVKVCRRVLSLEEANAICEYARKASGEQVARDRLCSIIPPPPGTAASTLPGSVGGGGGSVISVSVAAPSPVADTTTTATAPLAASSNTSTIIVATNPTAGDGQSGGAVREGSGTHDPNDARVSLGGLEPSPSTDDGSVGDVLSTLFKEADTENKVRGFFRNKAHRS